MAECPEPKLQQHKHDPATEKALSGTAELNLKPIRLTTLVPNLSHWGPQKAALQKVRRKLPNIELGPKLTSKPTEQPKSQSGSTQSG